MSSYSDQIQKILNSAYTTNTNAKVSKKLLLPSRVEAEERRRASRMTDRERELRHNSDIYYDEKKVRARNVKESSKRTASERGRMDNQKYYNEMKEKQRERENNVYEKKMRKLYEQDLTSKERSPISPSAYSRGNTPYIASDSYAKRVEIKSKKEIEQENSKLPTLGNIAREARDSKVGRFAKDAYENNPMTSGLRFMEGVIAPQKAEDRTTFAERAGASWTRGTDRFLDDTIGGATKYIGKKTGVGWLEDAGESVSRYARKNAEGFQAKEKTEPFKFKDMATSRFYSDVLAEQLPNLATSLLAGGAVVKGIGAVTKGLSGVPKIIANSLGMSAGMSAVDSTGEAGSVYNEAERRKMTDSQKEKAFEETFAKNMLLNSGMDAAQAGLAFTPLGRVSRYAGRLGEIGLKAGAGAGMEAFQEGYQNKISSGALGDKFSWTDPSTVEAMVIGGLLGGVTTGGMAAIETKDTVEKRTQEKMKDSQKRRFDAVKNHHMKNGDDETTARDKAFEDFSQQGGGTVINEAVQEVINDKKREREVANKDADNPITATTKKFNPGEEVILSDGAKKKVTNTFNDSVEVQDENGEKEIVSSSVVAKPFEAPETKDNAPEFRDRLEAGQQVDLEGVPEPVTIVNADDPAVLEVETNDGERSKVDRKRVIAQGANSDVLSNAPMTMEQPLISRGETVTRNGETFTATEDYFAQDGLPFDAQRTLNAQSDSGVKHAIPLEQTDEAQIIKQAFDNTVAEKDIPQAPIPDIGTPAVMGDVGVDTLPNMPIPMPQDVPVVSESAFNPEGYVYENDFNDVSLQAINENGGTHFTNWYLDQKKQAIKMLRDALPTATPEQATRIQHDIDVLTAFLKAKPAFMNPNNVVEEPAAEEQPLAEETVTEDVPQESTTYNAEIITPSGVNEETGRPTFFYSKPNRNLVVIPLNTPKTMDGKLNKKKAYLEIMLDYNAQTGTRKNDASTDDKGTIFIGATKKTRKAWEDKNIHDVFLDIPEYKKISPIDILNYLEGREVAFQTIEEQNQAETQLKENKQATEQRMIDEGNPHSIFQANKDEWNREPFESTHIRFQDKARSGREYLNEIQVIEFETGKGMYFTRRTSDSPYINPSPIATLSKIAIPIEEAQAAQQTEQPTQEAPVQDVVVAPAETESAQAVRNILRNNPTISNEDIIDELMWQELSTTSMEIDNIRSQMQGDQAQAPMQEQPQITEEDNFREPFTDFYTINSGNSQNVIKEFAVANNLKNADELLEFMRNYDPEAYIEINKNISPEVLNGWIKPLFAETAEEYQAKTQAVDDKVADLEKEVTAQQEAETVEQKAKEQAIGTIELPYRGATSTYKVTRADNKTRITFNGRLDEQSVRTMKSMNFDSTGDDTSIWSGTRIDKKKMGAINKKLHKSYLSTMGNRGKMLYNKLAREQGLDITNDRFEDGAAKDFVDKFEKYYFAGYDSKESPYVADGDTEAQTMYDKGVQDAKNKPKKAPATTQVEQANAPTAIDAEREAAIEAQYQLLKEQMKNRGGIEQGNVQRNEMGEIVGRTGRISNNPQWYQDFYKQYGKAPNNTELREIATRHVDEGYKEGIDTIPAWQSTDQRLEELAQRMITNPEETDGILAEMTALEQAKANTEETKTETKYDMPKKEAIQELESALRKIEEYGDADEWMYGNIQFTLDRVKNDYSLDKLSSAVKQATDYVINKYDGIPIPTLFKKGDKISFEADEYNQKSSNLKENNFGTIERNQIKKTEVYITTDDGRLITWNPDKVQRIEKEVKPDATTDNEVRNNVQGQPEIEQPDTVQGATPERKIKRDSVPKTGDSTRQDSGASGKRDADTGSAVASDTGGLTDTEPRGNRGIKEVSLAEEVPAAEANTNYRITKDDDLKIGNKKETAKRNIEIIKLALKIQEESRPATKEEQQQLVRYTGWGGLKDVLDEEWRVKEEWKSIRKELKDILTDEQFKQASQSRLNAHYTDKAVIDGIYNALQHFGFKGGRVLEPSMGIGHFLGMSPDSLYNKMKFTGVELDSITGLIGKLLYPQADVRVEGFQDAQIPDNYFDVAIGNVPFGKYGVHDPKFNKIGLSNPIHDYFFAKSLDKVREGGLIALITSRYTLDKDGKLQAYMKDKVEFLGAVRLPSGTFKGSADTEVVTDIVFLKKLKGNEKPKNEWLGTGNYRFNSGSVKLNQYFVDNPKMMLGTPTLGSGMYTSNEFTLQPKKTVPLLQDIDKAVQTLDTNVFDARQTKQLTEAEITKEIISAEPGTRNGSYVVKDGKIYQNENGQLIERKLGDKPAARMKGMLQIRDSLLRLLDAQVNDKSDSMLKGLRTELNKAYDKFVKTHGFLNQQTNTRLIADDPDAYVLLAVENWNNETKKATKADIFSKNTISKYVPVETANTPNEALSISLMEYGNVNVNRISHLLGMSEEETVKSLGNTIFFEPKEEMYVTREEYLSSNVRIKLVEAETAAKTDKKYQTNIEELKKVIPTDIPISDIEVEIGASWLPSGTTETFITEHLLGYRGWRKDAVSFDYEPNTGTWFISKRGAAAINGDPAFTNSWGTPAIKNSKFLESILNRKQIKIKKNLTDEFGNKTSVVDQKATLEARGKAQRLKEEFKTWVKDNPDIAQKTERLYNDTFNNTVLREYDGSHLPDILPNMNPTAIKGLRQHQKNAIFRATQQQSTLFAHAVGAGKTFEMIASMMEMKRMGLVKKPVWVVPNHLVGQMANDFLKLYPSASVLVPSKKDFETAKRKQLFAKIATNNYDVVILASSNFSKIAVHDDTLKRFYEDQINQLRVAMMMEEEKGGGKSRMRTRLLTMIENLETKMKRKLDKSAKDTDTATFEQMGFDAVVVDEAHLYKNLMYGTKQGNVGGLGNVEGSDRALDMYMKTKIVQENNGRVIFATGTPISNSIAEMYHMLRYLGQDALADMNMNNFDAWADVFTEIGEVVQLSHEGKGFKTTLKVKNISNAPELLSIWQSIADVWTTDALLEKKLITHPKHERHRVDIEASDELLKYVEYLGDRGEAIRGGNPIIENDNPLFITTDGRKAALDMRLVDKNIPDNPNFKIHQVAKQVVDIYKSAKKDKGTQLIFIDGTSPVGKDKVEEDGTLPFNYYGELKRLLMRNGLKDEEIAFIQDYDTDAKKIDLFTKVNDGEIRVLMGSSDAMGAGMNVQKRLKALHHVTPTFKPSDLEQREGRILRQGNIYEQNGEGVDIYTYVSINSFDAYLWQLIEDKAKIINKVMSGKIAGRKIEDNSDLVLNAAQIKAVASGDPRIMEYESVKADIEQLEISRNAHANDVSRAKVQLEKLPSLIQQNEALIEIVKKDSKLIKDTSGDKFKMKFGNTVVKERKEAAKRVAGSITTLYNRLKKNSELRLMSKVGEISGFDVMYSVEKAETTKGAKETIELVSPNGGRYGVAISESQDGQIRMLENKLDSIAGIVNFAEEEVAKYKNDLKKYEKVAKSKFDKQTELDKKTARKLEIENELDIDKAPVDEYVLDDEDMTEGVSRLLNLASDGGTDRIISPKVAKQAGDLIANGLDTVLRSGYVEGRGARGTYNYNKRSGNIKRKDMMNMRVIAHELGHAFEQFVGPKQFKKFTQELESVAEKVYPDGKKLEGKDKRKEGLAELFQLYMIDPEASRELAPDTVAFMEQFINSSEQLSKPFEQAMTLIQNEVEGGLFKAAAGAIQFVNDKPLDSRTIGNEYSIESYAGDTIRAKAKGLVKRFIYRYIDLTIPFQDYQKELDKNNYIGQSVVKKLLVSGNANERARHQFTNWATNKAGRYIINYQSKEELPDFLQPRFEKMMQVDPEDIKVTDDTSKRYKEAYKRLFKEGVEYPKEAAALEALSSRSLQEVAVEAINYVENVIRKEDVPAEFQQILDTFAINEKGKKKKVSSYEVFSTIAQAYRYNERYSILNEDGTMKFPNNPMSQAQAQATIDIGRKYLPNLEELIQEYTYNLSEITLQKAVDGGTITKQDMKNVKKGSAYYIPSYSAVKRNADTMDEAGGRKTAKQTIKSYQDTQEVVLDILTASINKMIETEASVEFKSILDTLEKGLKTDGMGKFGEMIKPNRIPQHFKGAQIEQQMVDLFEESSIIDPNDMEGTVTNEVFRIFVKENMFENGKPVLVNWHFDKDGKKQMSYMRVAPDLYNSIMSLRPIQVSSLVQWLSRASSFTRQLALLNLKYLKTTLERDTATAYIQRESKGFRKWVSNTLKGMALSAEMNPDITDQYVNSGAFMSNPENVLESFSRKSSMKGLLPTKNPSLFKLRNGRMVKFVNPSNYLNWSEGIHRYAEYIAIVDEMAKDAGLASEDIMNGRKKLTKEQLKIVEEIHLEAGYRASEVTSNFRKHGISEKFREVTQPISFLHGTVQGTYREVEEIKKHGWTKASKRWTFRMATTLVPLTLAAWTLSRVFGEDEEEIPSDLRDKYWFFPTPWGYYSVAKPFTHALPLAYMERFLDDVWGEDGARKWYEQAYKPFVSMAAIPLMPIWLQTFGDLKNNKTWWGGQIIPYWQQQNTPDYMQYDSNTSSLAKWQAEIVFRLRNRLNGIDVDDKEEAKKANYSYGYPPKKFDYLVSGIFGRWGTTFLQVAGGKPGKDLLGAGSIMMPEEKIRARNVDKFYKEAENIEKYHKAYGVKGEPSDEVRMMRAAKDAMSTITKIQADVSSRKDVDAKKKTEVNKNLIRAKRDLARFATDIKMKDKENLQATLDLVEEYDDYLKSLEE